MKIGVQFHRAILVTAAIVFVSFGLATAATASPSSIDALVGRYYEANEWCRGYSESDPRTARGCDLRQEIEDQLSELGYCFGSFETYGAQAGWMPCVKQERYNPDKIIGRENGWEFVWNERNQRCFVRKTYDQAVHVAIGVSSVNDDAFFWFGEIGTSNSIFSQPWDKPRRILMIFDGQRQWQADLRNRARGENVGFEVEGVPAQFLTDIARSNNLRVYIPDANYDRIIGLRGSAQALNRIADCESYVAREKDDAAKRAIEAQAIYSQIPSYRLAHTRRECSEDIPDFDDSVSLDGSASPGSGIPLRVHVSPNGGGVYWVDGNAYEISQSHQTSDEAFEFSVGSAEYEIHLTGVLARIKQVVGSNEYNFTLLNCDHLEDQYAWRLPNYILEFDLSNIVTTGILTGTHPANGLRVSTIIDLSDMYYTIGNADISRSLLEYSMEFILDSDIFHSIQPWYETVYDSIFLDDINLLIERLWIDHQNGTGDATTSHAAEQSLGISTAVDNYLSSAGERIANRNVFSGNPIRPTDIFSGIFPDFRRKIVDYAAMNIENDERIIKFYETDKYVFRWIIEKEHISWEKLDIDPEELSALVNKVAGSLNFETNAEFDRNASGDLFDRLFGDVREEIISSEKLTLVVSGALTLLPASVLVVPDSSGYVTSRSPFLIEKTAIMYVPSIRDLVFERGMNERKLSYEFDSLVGFGNPVFSWSDERFNVPEDYPNIWRGELVEYNKLSETLVALPGTELELKQVAQLFDESHIYIGEDATESRVRSFFNGWGRNNQNTYDVAYFATHGLVAAEMSEFREIRAEPSLILSLPKAFSSTEDDGVLTSTEISDMDMEVSLVVLSACNTASSNGFSPDGLSGLVRDFMVAGAQSVLATHWRIADDTTAELMTRFFQIVREEEGVSLAEGLRRAMVQQLEAAEDEAQAHPRFWAPFVLVSRGG